MSLKNLGELIKPELLYKFVDAAEILKVVSHQYGTAYNIPLYPCWMEYLNEGGVQGSISFTRNTDKHPVLSEMVTLVLQIFSEIFDNKLPLLRERVHFIRTKGNIVPHRDEGGRRCCINIGIKNSTGALTKIGIDDTFETFDERHKTYIINPGVGYLLDTSRIHAVTATNEHPRYLITYGFAESFAKVSTLLSSNKIISV
jgi:hypothetical protein